MSSEEKRKFSPEFIALVVFILLATGILTYYLTTIPCPLTANDDGPPNVAAENGGVMLPSEADNIGTQPTPPNVDSPMNPTGSTEVLPDYLTPDQADKLESWGVKVDEMPKSITDETETCLINAVGEQRAEEIKTGSEPSSWELIKAARCF